MIRNFKIEGIQRSIESVLSEIHPKPIQKQPALTPREQLKEVVTLLKNLSENFESIEERVKNVESYFQIIYNITKVKPYVLICIYNYSNSK